MQLGAFSVSLAVSDLSISHRFYETLGFEAKGGDAEQGWLILKNGDSVIGLFQGMFDGNLLTFNPGWNQNAEAIGDFTDVRDIQTRLKEAGFKLDAEADPETTGPASVMLKDPDGNVILIDQHL